VRRFTGVESAAPILFDVLINYQETLFQAPLNNLYEAEVCTLSGYLAQNDCSKPSN
jgi:penicillin-binding protein 1C